MIHFRTAEFFFRTKVSFQNLHETCIEPQKLYKLSGSTNTGERTHRMQPGLSMVS